MNAQIVQLPSQMVRIAQLILDQLHSLQNTRMADISRRAAQVYDALETVRLCRQKLDTCLWRGWFGAAKSVKDQFVSATRNLPYCLDQLSHAVQATEPQLPKLRDIFEDLEQLEDEFGEIRWANVPRTLSVVTEDIVLEDIRLGAFEVRLDISMLNRLPADKPYRIVALDPHPAASNSSVTHPHVSDESLCAGDASAAIVTTLSTGRICDFFTLVRSVLTNYNPNSPYVSLDRWEGTACQDCGYTMDSDDTYYCTSCDRDYCGECISSCHGCQDSTCRGCLEECSVCGESYCCSCMTRCPVCRQRLCGTCLDDMACSCHEEDQEETDNGTTQDQEADSAQPSQAA